MTFSNRKQIKLGYHLSPEGGWADINEGFVTPYDVEPLIKTAQKAEKALFDFVFRADVLGAGSDDAAQFRYVALDPLLALSAVATATNAIGLVGSVSTTFTEPYNTARQMLSLDHLSRGRAGWNAVTSFQGERAFNHAPLPSPHQRYQRAAEFLEIVHGLWSSWQAGAFIGDKRANLFADARKIAPYAFQGAFFDVEAISPLPPSPQGRPVQFQAGVSDEGMRFGAHFAQAIFSASPDIGHAQRIYREIKSLAAEFDRKPADILIFNGMSLVIGATEEEASTLFRALSANVDLAAGRRGVESYLGDIDLSSLSPDEPIPAALLPEETSELTRRPSRAALLKAAALKPGNTLRDVIQTFLFAKGGHFLAIQSYAQAAETLEHWFRQEAADGFVLSFPAAGDQFDRFAEHVIPRLQHKGLFRRQYHGLTLRDHLGL